MITFKKLYKMFFFDILLCEARITYYSIFLAPVDSLNLTQLIYTIEKLFKCTCRNRKFGEISVNTRFLYGPSNKHRKSR